MPNVHSPTGVDLYYETYGSGQPLVLIPSTAFSAEVWKPYQVPGLSKALNLILHDPRGTGRSTASQQVYTINQMANDVVALLDHLQIASAHVLGHSMGGRIALEMALNFPGRVKSLSWRQAAPAGTEARTGLHSRLAPLVGARAGGKRIREISARRVLRIRYVLYSRFSRAASGANRRIFPGSDGDARAPARIHSPEHRPPQLGGDPSPGRRALPDAGVDRQPTIAPAAITCSRPKRSRTHSRRGDESSKRPIARFLLASSRGNEHIILDWVKRHAVDKMTR